VGGTPAAPAENTTPGPNFAQAKPALSAGVVTAAVTASLAAFWAVAADAGWYPWLQPNTQTLINGAVIAVVAMLAAVWAERRTTPIATPKLQSGTHVEVLDAQGATTGHVEVNSPEA
jgi:hypothetical protein